MTYRSFNLFRCNLLLHKLGVSNNGFIAVAPILL